jgi:hypothetical protein
MILYCPICRLRHVDDGEFKTKPHHTHACQNKECGHVWRPAIVPTVGVFTLPGFLDTPEPRLLSDTAVILKIGFDWRLHAVDRMERLPGRLFDAGWIVQLSKQIGHSVRRPEEIVGLYELACEALGELGQEEKTEPNR